jgi:glutamate N-acetyltransferase/amino-acid N-acetyltransferase
MMGQQPATRWPGLRNEERFLNDQLSEESGGVTFASGFQASAAACGLKDTRSLDVALVQADRPCTAAALFTRNRVAAAPVELDRATMQTSADSIVGVVANAGNANACTGKAGMEAARGMQRSAAAQFRCRPDQVLVLSTGVIGVPLDLACLERGIEQAGQRLDSESGHSAAQAIMTTDTRPKEIALAWEGTNGPRRLGGMAKGSGMIHPDMATMLAVLTTDLPVPVAQLQPLLQRAADQSFNCISVDGDTSTNDTVLLLSRGGATGGDQELELFAAALNQACWSLAQQIVRDGEGARRVVAVSVAGAPSDGEARQVARTIATSPLVKTAFAGGDPNWGRIMAAAGRAGVAFDAQRVRLTIGDEDPGALVLIDQGLPTGYREESAAAIFSGDTFSVGLDLQAGDGRATVWTTDLTHTYITINSHYRT